MAYKNKYLLISINKESLIKIKEFITIPEDWVYLDTENVLLDVTMINNLNVEKDLVNNDIKMWVTHICNSENSFYIKIELPFVGELNNLFLLISNNGKEEKKGDMSSNFFNWTTIYPFEITGYIKKI
jgi:hypothetical protein